jgi:hypothetical protein
MNTIGTPASTPLLSVSSLRFKKKLKSSFKKKDRTESL